MPNEYGGLLSPPSNVTYRYEMTAAISKTVRQYVIASYLMGKEQAAGVELCCTQCYGIAAWFPEYAAAVGHPLGPPSFATGPHEVTTREYSSSLVLANAYNAGSTDNGRTITVKLPARAGGCKDLYGTEYTDSVSLEPQTAVVLLFAL